MEHIEFELLRKQAVAKWSGNLPVRVFLTEDTSEIARLVQQWLAEPGIFEFVGHAQSADGSPSMLKESKADLWLLDIYFRGPRTGLEVIGEVRKAVELTRTTDQLPSVKILVMTGKGEEHDVESLFARANGFLAKPFSSQTFFEAVGTVLGGRLFYRDGLLDQLPAPPHPPYFPNVALPETLSGEDRAYIHAVLCGKSDDEIAHEFGLARNSIHQKRSRIADKWAGVNKNLDRFLLGQLRGANSRTTNRAASTPQSEPSRDVSEGDGQS